MKNQLWRLLGFVCALWSLALPAAASGRLPQLIEVPDGFNPEGIASGPGKTVFVGSINSGAVYQANVRTGQGHVVVPASEGRAAIGLKWDRRSGLLYVAGGATGKVFIYDAETGASVADVVATTETSTFVNDAVVARDAVYFTDSYRPVIYRLPLSSGGQLPSSPGLQEIPLGGEFEFISGEFNANGIELTPDRRGLLIVSSVLGRLYRVDPQSGWTRQVHLGDATLANGDGILLSGKTLYVVQNFDNQIAAVRLNFKATRGRVKRVLTSEHFDVPTTVARVGFGLYAVNARFSTEVTPDTEYHIVRVPLLR